MLTTLRYFREEYEEHIFDKKCRAKACAALSNYVVMPEACKGCGVCKKNCPVDAITGELKGVHVDRHREVREVRHLRSEVPVRRDREGVRDRVSSPEGSTT